MIFFEIEHLWVSLDNFVIRLTGLREFQPNQKLFTITGQADHLIKINKTGDFLILLVYLLGYIPTIQAVIVLLKT